MKQKTRPQRKSKSAIEGKSEATEVGTFPLSTRFTEAQRRWIDAAAKTKGWTPANFIRQAAAEKSVHVLNLATANRFDFDAIATAVSKQLCEADVDATAYGDDGSQVTLDRKDLERQLGPDVLISVDSLAAEKILAFRKAVQLGGLEFIALVLERCEKSLEDKSRADLPEPISPE